MIDVIWLLCLNSIIPFQSEYANALSLPVWLDASLLCSFTRFMHSTLSKFSDCQLSNTSGSEGLSFILYATRELERSLIVIFHASSEPVIRMGVLGTVGLLLDRNAERGWGGGGVCWRE